MELERGAEVSENEALLLGYSFRELEKRNLALTKMRINSVSTGVYGRILLHLSRFEDQADEVGILRRFSPGDIVGVFQSGGGSKTVGQEEKESVEAIVYRVNNQEIALAFNEMHDFDNFQQPLNLCLMANSVTFQRCQRALDNVASLAEARGGHRLLDVLF
jgi:hypothetical protein